MKAKYLNPFTDFGFKKIFGEEASKPILIDFLNSLLTDLTIIDLSFKDKEHMGRSETDRKAVYDLYCETKEGEKIIIELQKAKQNYFKDRTLYYASFPIQEQAEKGDWDYQLKAVYCIGILDFKFDDPQNTSHQVVHSIQLKDQNNQVFYNKLRFVYLEMPHFKKTESELETRLDQWLYFIKHLEDFQSIPALFKDAIFTQAFETAELAKLNSIERERYEMNLKAYRDYINSLDTAYKDGRVDGREEGVKEGIEIGKEQGIEIGKEQGIEIGKLAVAKALKLKGMPLEAIAELTDLSLEHLKTL